MKNTTLEHEKVVDLLKDVIQILKETRNEISLMRMYLGFQATDFAKNRLEKIASTLERKKVWILLDGTVTTNEIAETVGISPRAVQYFIKELRKSDLIVERERGYSQRRIDLIPSEWEEIEKAIEAEKGGE